MPTATMPPPVQPEPWVAKPVRLYFALEVEPDELLLELDELELDDDEELLELDEEELLLDEELEELELDELLEPPEAGVIMATERASWLLLEAVQLMVAEPVALGASVEPAPPELDCEMPQRLV